MIAAIVAVLALLSYGLLQIRNAQDQKLALARAVSILPPGTEAAWVAYVDGRLAKTIRRRGDSVLVVQFEDQLLGTNTVVSPTTPYKVSCDWAIGAVVWFGTKEVEWEGKKMMLLQDSSIMVQVAGALAPPEEAPALGVDAESIAANHLSELLCERISARLREIMK